MIKDSDQQYFETENTMKRTEKKSIAFYQDMRFWLIVIMLIAFLGFILIQYPS